MNAHAQAMDFRGHQSAPRCDADIFEGLDAGGKSKLLAAAEDLLNGRPIQDQEYQAWKAKGGAA